MKEYYYGRYRGHTLGKKGLKHLETVLPLLKKSSEVRNHEIASASKAWLEIGFGYGEHLLEWLHLHPRDYYVGVELFQNGIANCVGNLSPLDYSRVALMDIPVQKAFLELQDSVFDGIFLLFPDPWPKKSHCRRRVLQRDVLDQCLRTLKEGGCLYIASDDEPLFLWMKEQVQHHGEFFWKIGNIPGEDPEKMSPWPLTWPISRYHQKALQAGRPCYHMIWEKAVDL